MNYLQSIGILAGGIGLFLLGMALMTDGLKLSAGPALHRILAAATRTRWHALGSGVLVTALVQSSSAVTVAAIGFVNAGLLGLGQTLWVLFGANVGTTMTGWIVALVGLKFKVEVLALPLVGLGVVLRMSGEGHRRSAFGTTLAGFGLLFLGIAVLQESFSGISQHVELPQGNDLGSVLLQVGAGALLTVLIQSSSAAMAIALTAAQGGLLSVESAAAVVIGANIGTTVNAVVASIGATANARRAAAAHVVFNVLTGFVALLLLPWLIGALGLLGQALALPTDPAAKLAIFHTTFNVLGVLLIWPLSGALTRWLQQRFRARDEDEAQPRHLDANVLAVPALALDALQREIARIGQFALTLARDALLGKHSPALQAPHKAHASLDRAAEDFVERMNRATMSADTSQQLARSLRVLRYYHTTAEQAMNAAAMNRAPALLDAEVGEAYERFRDAAQPLLELDAPVPVASEEPDEALGAMDRAYEVLKSALLAAGACGRIALADMDVALRHFSALRRAVQQARKAALMSASRTS